MLSIQSTDLALGTGRFPPILTRPAERLISFLDGADIAVHVVGLLPSRRAQTESGLCLAGEVLSDTPLV